MSNKKETPVNWLVFELSKVGYLPDGLPTDIHNKALKMESKKQQKYDEMLAMLESCVLALEQMEMKEPVGITQLIKESQRLQSIYLDLKPKYTKEDLVKILGHDFEMV
jgi:hypothetical protein